jgi:hypothetical protein
MTAERVSEIEFEVDAEELALLLAAPRRIDAQRVIDPVAVYGTEASDPLSLSGAANPVALV